MYNIVVIITRPRNNYNSCFMKTRAIYRKYFSGQRFYRWHRFLFELSLSGLGFLNHSSLEASGEKWFLKSLRSRLDDNQAAIIDVGAHKGYYSKLAKSLMPQARVIAFEPQDRLFGVLKTTAQKYKFEVVKKAVADMPGEMVIYDRADREFSYYGSQFKEVIENRGFETRAEKVGVTTIDEYCKENKIEKISLLKIDVEGGEIKVLQGAREMIAGKAVEYIQFEFNEMNILARTFFADFEGLLVDYELFRLLPDGLVSLRNEITILKEIYGYQNIVARLKK